MFQHTSLKHRTFWQEQSGGMMPMIAACALLLLAGTGAAVDMSRLQSAHASLGQALDAAGLAAGAKVSEPDLEAIVGKYLKTNFRGNNLNATITDYSVTVSEDTRVLTLYATATVDLYFMPIFGTETSTIQATSQITRESKGMELVLVVDTTGSMSNSAGGGISKMQAAKNAANALLDILYGDKDTVEHLWVGLVPFAQGVNIGTTNNAWTTTDSHDWGASAGHSWAGCVQAREANNRDTTEDPPSVALFPKYHWQCDSNNAWYGTNNNRNNCQTGSGQKYKSPLNASLGPNKSCSQAITPMASEKQTIVDAISTLTPDGNTHIVLGLAWGWRMLSPLWRGEWGGQMQVNELPLDYNKPLMNKVAILMTDGDNTISNSTRGAYGYLSEKRLGSTNSNNAVTEMNNRTLKTCTAMKEKNIIIYTVAFGTSISNTAQTMLKNCATKEAYYFYSPTAADLTKSFKQIGDSLANLIISK